jgi:hypothetical protein
MYIVTYKVLFGGNCVKKFETLDEAKDLVKELYSHGYREITLSKEIPMKVTVSVEF